METQPFLSAVKWPNIEKMYLIHRSFNPDTRQQTEVTQSADLPYRQGHEAEDLAFAVELSRRWQAS